MALRWSIPVGGPFSVGGRVGGRPRPTTAAQDLAVVLEQRAVRRDEAAARDERHRGELAERLEAVWPRLGDEQRVELEGAVTALASSTHGSMRSQWRAGTVMHLLDQAERAAAEPGRHRA